MWATSGMLQERTTPICRTPERAHAQGTGCAYRIGKKTSRFFCQSYREKSCLSFALCFPPRCTPGPAAQDQAGVQKDGGVPLALLSPFSPICPCSQSSCLRYPWVESPTGLISTSWRQRLASGVDISDFWGCEDAIAHICTSILLNKNHFQLGFGVTLPQKHAWTRTHIHKECPQPLTYLQPLDTTPRGWKPWVLDKRKGISAHSCRAEREQNEGWGKQWDITSMTKKLTFELFALSVTTLLLVDITSSAQQACILPFSYNNCSSFLFPDLVSVLDMVKKKRLCSKLPIENESTNAE